MINLAFKKLYDDVEIPQGKVVIDLKIHSFHRITEFDGIIPNQSETFRLEGGGRILVKMGYILTLSKHYTSLNYPDYYFQILPRKPTIIGEGLVPINTYISGEEDKELEIILYNTKIDRIILLKKGYRIAQLLLVPKIYINIIEK